MRGYKSLFLYLGITFGLAWGILFTFIYFSDFLIPITGPLNLNNPITMFVLYIPSIAGLVTYLVMGGLRGLKGILKKMIPRRQDLFWFPILFLVFVLFALSNHFGSVVLGVPVPKITLTVTQMITKTLTNLIEEVGLLGGLFGWIGFLLPFLQGKLKSNIAAGLLTGLIFGLWVLPEYMMSSFGVTTTYLLYVLQLMLFILFASYIFNATQGNLLFYFFSFWLAATGSHIQLYYFNTPVQVIQIIFFALAIIIIHIMFRVMQVDCQLQVFPDFIQPSSDNENVDSRETFAL